MSSSRQKSSLWQHFTSINAENKVKCLYCNRQLSVKNKSTCSLIRHINKKHPTLRLIKHKKKKLSTRHLVKQEDTESNDTITLTNVTQSTSPTSSKAVSVASPVRSVQPRTSLQPSQKINDSFHNQAINTKKQKEIDRQLVTMITKEYHPFSIVEEKEFGKLIHLLNPAYILPTREILSNSLIPAIYNETIKKVKSRLNRAFGVCLTIDGWTSRTGENYYAVTAHYIAENNDTISLDSDLLGCVSFTEFDTADDIYNKMRDVLVEWKIVDKVIAIVSDNAVSMSMHFGEWSHWVCFAHCLNVVTQTGMKEIEIVIEKIKTIVSYFKRSSHAAAQLNATRQSMNLPSLELKNDVPTRWNSTFDMIKIILALKNAIIATIADLNTPIFVDNGETEVLALTQNEWLVAEQSLQVLEVFNTLTTVLITQNKVTLSSIIIYLKQIKIHLQTCETKTSEMEPEITNMISRLLGDIDLQFFNDGNHIEENDLVGLSTILDPRYKKFGFIDETRSKKMLEKLYNIVLNMKLIETCENTPLNNASTENVAASTSEVNNIDDILFKNFDNEVQNYIKPANAVASAVAEVDKYLQEPLLPRKDANGVYTDPLLWWFQRKHIYPRLYQLVKTKLNILATSVPCQRIFTHAGQIINDKRANLNPTDVSKIVFLNYNLNTS